MEKKLTNEEIAKVFALYFGADVQTIDGNAHMMTVYSRALQVCLNEITLGQQLHGYDEGNGSLHRTYLNKNEQVKLLLTPLSEISDEDAVGILALKGGNNSPLRFNADYVRKWIDEYIKGADVFQYLVSKGYAVPLFFGVGHWANGMDAITLGIATPKNKGV